MDFNVGAFEPNHGRIQDFDCENVIGQPFNCLSKVEFWLFLWHSHIISLVLFVAIVGGTQCFDQIYLRKGCLCLWFCDNRKIFVELISSWCILILQLVTNMNISKFFVMLWTTILRPSQNWVTNINIGAKTLAFWVIGRSY
jgi:hypothetical protein